MTPTPSSQSIKFAGDIYIARLDIVSSDNYKVDITDQMIGIEMYEDMFSPFTSMSITVKESLDFISALPLRGEEVLNIEMKTPTFEGVDKVIKGKFYIYKISDRQEMTDRNLVYTLHCISYEALVDLNSKQSKAHSGNIGEIATSLLKSEGLNSNKNANVEPTKNAIKYISNFWSPVKNLNFLANAAITKSGSPSYFFYENRSGFNFISLETLYQQKPYQKFIKDNYARDTSENGGTSYRNLDRDYQRILEFKANPVFDTLNYMSKGAYASRMFAYDLVTKKYTAKDFNTLNNFQNMPKLNSKALYTEYKPVSPSNLIFNEIKHYGVHSGFADTSNTSSQQMRAAMVQSLRSFSVNITVFGRTDYTIGQKVYLEIPRSAVINKKDQRDDKSGYVDDVYSGNYIVTAINHIINRQGHTCVMELSKESTID